MTFNGYSIDSHYENHLPHPFLLMLKCVKWVIHVFQSRFFQDVLHYWVLLKHLATQKLAHTSSVRHQYI